MIPTTCREREGRHRLNEKGHYSPPRGRRKKLCIRNISAPLWLLSGCDGDGVTKRNRTPLTASGRRVPSWPGGNGRALLMPKGWGGFLLLARHSPQKWAREAARGSITGRDFPPLWEKSGEMELKMGFSFSSSPTVIICFYIFQCIHR